MHHGLEPGLISPSSPEIAQFWLVLLQSQRLYYLCRLLFLVLARWASVSWSPRVSTGISSAYNGTETRDLSKPAPPTGVNGTDGAVRTGIPTPRPPTTPGYVLKYSYIGCYVANPDGNFGLGNWAAQEIVTTSVDDCASLCASQSRQGSALPDACSSIQRFVRVCTCGDDLASHNYLEVDMNFKCNNPCNSTTPSSYFCGGQYGSDPLVSVFSAI